MTFMTPLSSSKIWKNDPAYPPLLRETHRAPERLFVHGQNLNPEDDFFAIVGTRRPSLYGKQMAEEFSAALAGSGFVIVSGLAYGIDAIAHEAALDAGGRTIAVLGSGLDHLSPACNIPLAKRIVQNGSIITEFEADVEPNKKTFPQRNRIIAGMSCSALIIEAPERSGALITARFSLDFNRDVFALPGNITQETSKGTNVLIRNGEAFPATCVQDIFEYMKIKNSPYEIHKNLAGNLTSEEENIYALLKKAPLDIEGIALEAKLPISKTNIVLSMLELKGLIEITGNYAFITR